MKLSSPILCIKFTFRARHDEALPCREKRCSVEAFICSFDCIWKNQTASEPLFWVCLEVFRLACKKLGRLKARVPRRLMKIHWSTIYLMVQSQGKQATKKRHDSSWKETKLYVFHYLSDKRRREYFFLLEKNSNTDVMKKIENRARVRRRKTRICKFLLVSRRHVFAFVSSFTQYHDGAESHAGLFHYGEQALSFIL